LPRELLGVPMKRATHADLTERPAEVAEEAIGSRAAIGARRVSIEEIQKKTAEFYKLDMREMHSVRRARRAANAPGRHVSSSRTHPSFAARYRKTFWRPRSYDATRDGARSPTRNGFPAHRSRPREQNLTNAPSLPLPQQPVISTNDRCRSVGKIRERRTKNVIRNLSSRF
jgi:hypothetical protein